MRDMTQFGISLPNFGKFGTKEFLLRAAKEAEALGYDSLWVSDHIVIPATSVREKSSSEFHGETLQDHFKFLSENFLDPFIVLSFIAAQTQKIKIGTSCVILPYRNPMLVAKMAATLDNLSDGRLILGVSHGWIKEEFHALGVPFEKRGKISDECIQAIYALWHDDEASFHGEYFNFDGMVLSPKPAQKPHPPLWVGGHKKKAMERAVNYSDGWHPTQFTPSVMKEEKEKMEAYAKSIGRDLHNFTLSIRLSLYITETKKDDASRRPCMGTLEQVRADVQGFIDAGVTHFVFDVLGSAQEKFLAAMKLFSEKIMKEIKK